MLEGGEVMYMCEKQAKFDYEKSRNPKPPFLENGSFSQFG